MISYDELWCKVRSQVAYQSHVICINLMFSVNHRKESEKRRLQSRPLRKRLVSKPWRRKKLLPLQLLQSWQLPRPRSLHSLNPRTCRQQLSNERQPWRCFTTSQSSTSLLTLLKTLLNAITWNCAHQVYLALLNTPNSVSCVLTMMMYHSPWSLHNTVLLQSPFMLFNLCNFHLRRYAHLYSPCWHLCSGSIELCTACWLTSTYKLVSHSIASPCKRSWSLL